MKRFCPNCGLELTGAEKFCPRCGFDLTEINGEPENNLGTAAPVATGVGPVEQRGSFEQEAPVQTAPPQNSASVYSAPKKKKIRTGWLVAALGALVVLVVAAIVGGFMFFGQKKLSGSYSSTSIFLFVKTTDTLNFAGSEVTETSDGEKINQGTYKISGNQLVATFGKNKLTATLVKNKKSFVVKSATGVAAVAIGRKYTLGKDKKETTNTTTSSVSNKVHTEATKKATPADDKTPPMNFGQIQKGDYTSLQGNWSKVATAKVTAPQESGGNQSATWQGVAADDSNANQMVITKNEITSKTVTIKNNAVGADNATEKLELKQFDDILTTALADKKGASDVTVSFYPRGTTPDFALNNDVTIDDTKNIIVVTSNDNQDVEVYVQDAEEVGMNLEQIQKGDFSSIEGSWADVASAWAGYKFDTTLMWDPDNMNKDKTAEVTKTQFVDQYVSVEGNIMTDIKGGKEFTYDLIDGYVMTKMLNPEISNDWEVTFYPKGTAPDFKFNNGVTVDTDQDLIVTTTSDKHYYDIYAKKAEVKPLDTEAIREEDFSTLFGRWYNVETGRTIVYSHQVVDNPYKKGNHYSKTAIKMTDNWKAGKEKIMWLTDEPRKPGLTYDPKVVRAIEGNADGSGDERPLAIVPKDVAYDYETQHYDWGKDMLIFDDQGEPENGTYYPGLEFRE